MAAQDTHPSSICLACRRIATPRCGEQRLCTQCRAQWEASPEYTEALTRWMQGRAAKRGAA